MNAPLNILHIITDLGSGGAETMLYRLVEALPREAGFAHAIISLVDVNQFDFSALGASVRSLNLKAGMPTPAALLQLRRWVASTRPDVVQGWMYHSNIAAALAVPSGVPLVWGIHHSLGDLAREKALTRWVIRSGSWLARRVQRIAYCSHAGQLQHEAVGYPAAKSLFIPNGFDCQSFRPNHQAARRLRSDLGLPDGALLVGHAARFHPVKNHLGLVRAFAMVAEHYPEAQLILVGRDVTASNAVLARAVNQVDLGGRVHLLGEQADMPGILPALDGYVSSSWAEAFPMVLGEAMACGVPCVTTDVGDAATIVGDFGWVVAAGDDVALAHAIKELLALSADSRRQLGEWARTRILTEYSLPMMAERYAAVYQELAAAKRRSKS